MYITQTYLGNMGEGAELYVYYLFEQYDDRQMEFTKRVESELGRLGELFGSRVTLFMPNAEYADRIGGQLRQVEGLWQSLQGSLPGLLLTPRPLREFDDQADDSIYLPFESDNPSAAVETISELKRVADHKLYWSRGAPPKEPRRFRDTLWEATELKPGLWGFRVDLRRLLGGTRS